jgi:hypothetical protein
VAISNRKGENMLYVGKIINNWEILLKKRVDKTVCVKDVLQGDYYLVQTGPEESVIITLPFDSESEPAFIRAVQKELTRIRSFIGKKITIGGGWK